MLALMVCTISVRGCQYQLTRCLQGSPGISVIVFCPSAGDIPPFYSSASFLSS
jgi:hypothetical protein